MNDIIEAPRTSASQASAGQYDAAIHLTTPEMAVIPPCTTYVAAANYLDSEVFERERQTIFTKLPVPASLSQDLPAPGSYRSVAIAGISVLLTRNKAGQAKAFLNSCSHRGTRLVGPGEAGSGLKLTCPYHAWTYNLEGQLIGVPKPECFVALDKSSYGLSALPCHEAGGVVWVSLDRSAKLDDEALGQTLIDDFAAIDLANMRVFRTLDFDLQANWKLISDAFLEGYHVTRLHAKTLARFFVDAPQMIERIGRHLRQTSGSRKGFSAADVSPEWPELRKSVVYAYIAFPNVVVVTSPTYVSVVILSPLAVDRTQARYIMLVDPEPQGEEIERLHERSFKLMSEAFGNEDFRAAELSHAGLRTGAIQSLTLGGMEQGVRFFHDIVEEHLKL
ncbi:MAG: aromatic ring-hydroxylating oxygenase subunit alpha [Panacagrimonas sp.]